MWQVLHDKCVESLSEVLFPARHIVDVRLHGGIAVCLRDLRISTAKQFSWLGFGLFRVVVHDFTLEHFAVQVLCMVTVLKTCSCNGYGVICSFGKPMEL